MSTAAIFGLCVFSFVMGQFFAFAIIAFFMGATIRPDESYAEFVEVEPPLNNVTQFRRTKNDGIKNERGQTTDFYA